MVTYFKEFNRNKTQYKNQLLNYESTDGYTGKESINTWRSCLKVKKFKGMAQLKDINKCSSNGEFRNTTKILPKRKKRK
jgi:hypothetical protein